MYGKQSSDSKLINDNNNSSFGLELPSDFFTTENAPSAPQEQLQYEYQYA